MASMKRPRLKAIRPLSDFRMNLTFVNGEEFVVSFAPLFERSKGLARLRNPKAFNTAVMEEWGWEIEWPELDIQIGADTLWMDAQIQNAKTPEIAEFISWRLRNRLSLSAAAKALGVTTRTISAFGTGERPIPRYISLACKGYEVEANEWPKTAA